MTQKLDYKVMITERNLGWADGVTTVYQLALFI